MANEKKGFFSVFLNGLIWENPTFTLMLGMCPTLAITTAGSNGIGMGLATTFVLVCSNLFISLLRKVIPDKVRIPAFIVVIASFVTILEMLLKAFLPEAEIAVDAACCAGVTPQSHQNALAAMRVCQIPVEKG